MKNNFGNEYSALPIEIQKEITLKILVDYQQVIANLLIEINNLQSNYLDKTQELQELQSPTGDISYLLRIYENKNGIYTNTQSERAHHQLNNHYKPLVTRFKKEIKELKNDILRIKDEINKNKNQYYYFYSKYKKL